MWNMVKHFSSQDTGQNFVKMIVMIQTSHVTKVTCLFKALLIN